MQIKKGTLMVLLLVAVLICLILAGGTGNVILAVSTVLDNCDSASGWTGSNTITLDTTNKKEGAGCLSMTGNGVDWFKKTFSPAVNSGVTQNNGYLHLWLYVSDVTKISGDGQFEITSSGAPDTNEYAWLGSSVTLVNGWNELNLKISSAIKTGTPSLSAINFFRLYRPLSASITCKIDDLRFTDTIGGSTPTPSSSLTPTSTKTPTPTKSPTPTATKTPTPTSTPTSGGVTLLDNCDNISGWTGSDAITLDTTNKKEGAGCLAKTGSGIDWFKKSFSPAVNSGVTESNGYLHLWLYVSDVTKISGDGQFEITSSGAPDINEYAWLGSSVTMVNGWNELYFKISNATKTGTPNLSAINFFRLYRPLSASVTCKIDYIGFTTSTSVATPTPMATPTPTVTPTVTSGAGDVVGKVIVGYQGWFNATGDGSPVGHWRHWSDPNAPGSSSVTFELYPDVREYSALFQTSLANLGNGQVSKLFSSYTDQTVNLHFQWMRDYGIDGAALQRFGCELGDAAIKSHRDAVATKMKTASESYGRKFYIMYDISRMGSDFDTILENDWTNTIINSLHLTSSLAYAKQNGKPVVCIWGIGLTDRPGTATQCLNLINWFKNQGLYVIGGVPSYWRDCDNPRPLPTDPNAANDSKTGFQNVYKALNMVQPWLVTRIRGISGLWSCDVFKQYIIGPDWEYCKANGMDYAPVMFPGFAWSNWNTGPQNEIPRVHGDFMWNQAYNIRTLGIPSAYVAMFDEYDEATAIAKAAEDSTMKPTNKYFLTLDADGTRCTSDFYLRLTGDAAKMIKGTIGATASHPTTH